MKKYILIVLVIFSLLMIRGFATFDNKDKDFNYIVEKMQDNRVEGFKGGTSWRRKSH